MKKLINTLFKEFGKQLAQSVFDKLMSIENHIISLESKIMALSQEVKDAFAKVDAATNLVADRIKALADQIAAGGTDTAEIVSQLNAEADRLTSIGADPNNPVPPTV